MHIFTGIDTSCNDENLRAAARAVAQRLVPLPVPRSLCELQPDDEDFEWLCRWGRYLQDATVRRWLGRVPVVGMPGVARHEALGLLLMLLWAEVGRREAQEGGLWPAVRLWCGEQARKVLFVQGQPSSETKEAMRASARRFALREVFNVAGGRSYYLSVYLQFGFTHYGIARLPWWLAGYAQSEAVRGLLSGTRRSASFVEVWETLVRFRRGEIPADRARPLLAHSPWVLPGWCDELLHAAGARPELDAGIQADSAMLLADARLRWDGEGPACISATISGLDRLPLGEPRYDLSVDGAHLATLLRDADGGYGEPAAVAFEPRSPVVFAALRAPGEDPVAQVEIPLWDPLDDVVAFEFPGGRRVDAAVAPMHPHRRYALLTRHDLQLTPAPEVWRMVCGGEYRLWLLPQEWPASLQASLAGEKLWAPHLRPDLVSEEPPWVAAIYIRGPLTVPLGDAIHFTLQGMPAGAEALSARLGGRSMPLDAGDRTPTIGPITLTGAVAAAGLRFRLALRHAGETVQIERAAPTEAVGAATRGDTGWEAIEANQEIDVADAAAVPWRFFLGAEWGGEARKTLALMEGDSEISRPPVVPMPLRGLRGYGAPLRLRPGPYNADRTVLRVAGSVVDHGLLRAANSLFGRNIVLTLARPVAPDGDYRVVLWPSGRPAHLAAAAALKPIGPEMWGLDAPGDAPEAVGISYRGHRVGATWPGDPVGLLPRHDAPAAEQRAAAALLRWLHLPLLAPGYAKRMRSFVERSPATILLAWLRDEGLPEGLVHERPDGAWYAVVRGLFWGWKPGVEELRALVTAYGGEGEAPLIPLALALASVDPLLLVRVCRLYPHLPGVSRRDIRALILAIQGRLLDLGEGGIDAEMWRRLHERVADSVGVHVDFLEQGLIQRALAAPATPGQPGDTMEGDGRNLRMAMDHDMFRRYLAARVLEKVLTSRGEVR